RAGDEHLTDVRLSGDPRADGDRQASELAVDDVAFPRVHADANAEPERADGLLDRACAADRARGSVEARCEEAVAGGVDGLPLIARELAPNDRVVLLEQRGPRGP